jgi:peptidoglycan/xylan/chitin deacetylase (PgdA/CDA1 family)
VEQVFAPTGETRALGATAASSLWLTWPMLRELHRAGHTIGGHTVSHRMLGKLPRDEQHREIAGCHARITAEIGTAPTSFAYPAGRIESFDTGTREMLRSCGFSYGFSYYGGRQPLRKVDLLDIRRVPVEYEYSFDRFVATCAWPAQIA